MLDDKTFEKAANKFISFLLPKNYIDGKLQVIYPGFKSDEKWVQITLTVPKGVEYDKMVSSNIIKDIENYIGVKINLMGVVLIKQN